MNNINDTTQHGLSNPSDESTDRAMDHECSKCGREADCYHDGEWLCDVHAIEAWHMEIIEFVDPVDISIENIAIDICVDESDNLTGFSAVWDRFGVRGEYNMIPLIILIGIRANVKHDSRGSKE